MSDDMTPRERLKRALACKEVDRPPVTGMTTTATVELMDYAGAAWPEVHSNAELMTKLGLAAYPFFGLESARIPYCLTYEVEALGCKVFLGKKNSTPMVKSNPYYDRIDEELVLPSHEEMLELARNKVILEAARAMKEGAGEDLPTVLGVTGPFTIAGHLVGAEKLLMWVLTQPENAHKIVKFAAEYEHMWLQEVEKLNFDSIQMSDPSASHDMLSPEMFDEFAGPYIRRSFEGLENTKKVLHICGNMEEMLEQMISTHADALSLEEKTDPFKAVEIVNGRAALVGNVGVVSPLLQGNPGEVRDAALISAEAGFNIINAGCGLSAMIPKQNILAMVEAIKGMTPRK